MDLALRKQKLIEAINKIDDHSVIAHIEALLISELRSNIEPMSEKDLTKRLQQSLKDAANEKLTNTENLLNEILEWD